MKFRTSDGRQHTKSFPTKKAAVDYDAGQRTAPADGIAGAPRIASTKLSELAERWILAGSKRDSTRLRDAAVIRNHILPGLGPDRSLATVSKADCQDLVDKWLRGGAAPRTASARPPSCGPCSSTSSTPAW